MKKCAFLLLLMVSMSFVSCKYTMVVVGEPGYCIYTGTGDYLGTIGQSGQIEIDMRKKGRMVYYPYLMAKKPEESYSIPFGTNVKWTTSSSSYYWWYSIFPPLVILPICSDFDTDHFYYLPTQINNQMVKHER